MKIGVLILIDELKAAGAENVAVNIAVRLQQSAHYRPVVCATRLGGTTEDTLRKDKIRFIILHRKHLFDVYKFAFLARIIREENIKLIHAHKSGSAIWGVIIGKLTDIHGVIVHIHGRPSSWKHGFAESLGCMLSDKIVTVSESERLRLLKRGGSASKITTMFNGINITKFRPEPDFALKSSLGLRNETLVVGISAELRPEKNHDVFLLAAREILKNVEDVCFLIVGDGERRRELEQFALSIGVLEKCRFTGFVKSVAEMISIMDVGVLCSSREALPLTLLEYMASGKPIVATRVGGVPEVVSNGINGFLVESGDYVALAEKIILLLRNRSLALTMGSSSLSIVKEKFTEDVMIRHLEALYGESLIQRNGTRPRRPLSPESSSTGSSIEP